VIQQLTEASAGGLGAATASQDTDVEPVVLDIPLATLRAVDEEPYWSAIAVPVQMIMVSWATYPALDASLPAGLSPAVVQGELRGYLGYQGVTITDALEAGAVSGLAGALSSGQLGQADFTASVQRIMTLRDGL
jgi:beta-N-acetylhexosaminidase